MTDEKEKTDGATALPKRTIPDPFAKLTDQDWIDAMSRGKEVADARNERIRKAIKGEDGET